MCIIFIQPIKGIRIFFKNLKYLLPVGCVVVFLTVLFCLTQDDECEPKVEKPAMVLVTSEKSVTLPLANEISSALKAENDKPNSLLPANEKPSPPLHAASGKLSPLLLANEKEVEAGGTAVSLTETEVVHLKQCRNKVKNDIMNGT